MIYGLYDMGLAEQPSSKNEVLNSSIYIQFPFKRNQIIKLISFTSDINHEYL